MESTESPNFYQYWSIFRRRWPYAVATFASVVTLTYFYAITRAPIYGAQGKLLFKQDQSSSLIKFDSQNQQQNNANSSPDDRSQATEAKVISSTPNLQKALKRINILKQRKIPLKLEELQQGIEIGSLEKTDIMQVSYKGQDPKLAALVVNELMKVYIESHLESSRAAAASAAKFIGAQLPRVKGEVYSADLAVRNFKEKYQITDLGQTQGAIAANLERIGSQIDSVEAELAALNSRSKTLQEKLGVNAQQALSVNSLSKSPVMQGVLQDLREVQGKLAETRSRYLESSPGVVQLKDKETQLKRTIQDQYAQILQQQQTGRANKLQIGQIQEDLTTELIKLEVDRTGLASQLTVLSKQRDAYRKKAAVLPRLEQQLREDQRELSAAQSTYEALLKSLQEIKVIENQTVGNVRIIEAAQIPQQPINASKTSAMTAGSLAGILLSAAVVYLLEKIDKRIKSVEQVRELFEYTLLATIPDFSKTNRSVNAIATSDERRLAIPVLERSHSSITESYRMLHANLTFFNSEKVMQVIVVTSSVPKEGKSTTCANLAAVIANLGYRVLIVDADLRRPSQHEIWQIPNDAGLKNFIAARGDLSSPVIQKVMNNLYVLSAGLNTSSPEFIDSRSMAALIKQCRNKYDYVIFDTPPLAVTADAHILGKIADGVMVVTRPRIADSINSKQAKESLDRSGQNIIGIVVNGVNSEKEFHRYQDYAVAGHEESGSRHASNRRRNWLENSRFFRR